MNDYKIAYDLLSGEAEEDLRTLEQLVEDAVRERRAFTSGSLPEGFDSKTIDEADFGFTARKKYDDGAEIKIEYTERSNISFGRPDSSNTSIDVKMPYSITNHWDQRR